MKPVAVVLIEAPIATTVPMNPRTRLNRPVPVVQVDDHQNRQDSNRGGTDSAEQLSSQEELGNARFTNRDALKDDG
jgi:hypothetical protein